MQLSRCPAKPTYNKGVVVSAPVYHTQIQRHISKDMRWQYNTCAASVRLEMCASNDGIYSRLMDNIIVIDIWLRVCEGTGAYIYMRGSERERDGDAWVRSQGESGHKEAAAQKKQ